MKKLVFSISIVFLSHLIGLCQQTAVTPAISTVNYFYVYSEDGSIIGRLDKPGKEKVQTAVISDCKSVVSVFPTIATDNIIVSIEQPADESNLCYTYKILSTTGVIFLQGIITESQTNINITTLDANLYIISFFNEDTLVSSIHFAKS